ncbi:protein DOWNY MILDEW RESISTANCE 6 [Cajanus cajan]|uniref:Hyoscyamine 6-dioxygenase n=1 Tax=Cajanus cajan TaxID=3821 RepID=A0A151R3K0_CAJCA|nr:protein DOWNY MILDEW RESISTANCE 6 [Cajanus cajan]KYP37157.1 Hyoscyamine 6-dioxygenase [Cajanus cajan]
MDQMLVSSWFNLSSSVPLSYVQPPESRPGNGIDVVASGNKIPVVDLAHRDRAETLKHILKASQEYGFFQVINHGVSNELMDDTLNIIKEFHAMPAEEKLRESSRDPNGSCRLYTSREINNKDVIQFWRDTLRHFCPPSEEFMEFLPQKPSKYREVVAKYIQEMRTLGVKILELLCEGLGLEPTYCSGGLSDGPLLLSHHYPPCPEPNLTLGAPKHRDPNLVTILLQEKDINALQVFKDGEWILVHPIPYAFVVNIGLMLQIISNGRVIGAEHRVVTNSGTARTTIAYFIRPTNEQIIEPAKPLTSSGANPIYRSIPCEEFLRIFMNKGPDIEPHLLL